MSDEEISRRLNAMERRQEAMHIENRAGIAEIQRTMVTLAEYQRDANGRTGKIETAVAVLQHQQRTTEEEIDEIKDAAKDAARVATREAVAESGPSYKRLATLGTAVGSGIFGAGMVLWKIGEAIFSAMK